MNSKNAKTHISEVIELMKSAAKEASARTLREHHEAWKTLGPEKFKVWQRENLARKLAQHAEDFDKYTTSPCGCYRDPGGHP